MSTKPDGASEPAEWVDGFLFVGNHLALDFLNTKLVNEGEPVELLPSVDAFARWLVAAGVTSKRELGQMLQHPQASSEAEHLLATIRAFRELLREAVLAIEAKGLPSQRFLRELNELLLTYPERMKLSRKGDRIVTEPAAVPDALQAFWSPIAAAAAALMTSPNPFRIRKCENCVVHFQDTSKKGSRRWCSMNLCGNKLKVAAYQERQRSSRR